MDEMVGVLQLSQIVCNYRLEQHRLINTEMDNALINLPIQVLLSSAKREPTRHVQVKGSLSHEWAHSAKAQGSKIYKLGSKS